MEGSKVDHEEYFFCGFGIGCLINDGTLDFSVSCSMKQNLDIQKILHSIKEILYMFSEKAHILLKWRFYDLNYWINYLDTSTVVDLRFHHGVSLASPTIVLTTNKRSDIA